MSKQLILQIVWAKHNQKLLGELKDAAKTQKNSDQGIKKRINLGSEQVSDV